MIHIFLVVIILVALLLVLGISAQIGRRYGIRELKHHEDHKLEVVVVAESAVFALLGLLIAFSFSGAYDRYDSRKVHILVEANVFDTAYELIDLVPAKFQPSLRSDVRTYLDLHLKAYEDIPFRSKIDADLNQAIIVQHSIWNAITTAALENTRNEQILLVIPALSKMFEVTHEGMNLTLVHPPQIIFILLLGLAALGAFLIGYNAADNKQKIPVHVISYVLLTAFTMYVIINLEYPRVGFIRFSSFDNMLMDVRRDMNYQAVSLPPR
jgi:heme/copper-type cytochrome/quinol oxidase subunit 2